jgi:rSAM/selenodomain-associated transferase 1
MPITSMQHSAMNGNVICIFAEYPEPGKVKTGLGEYLDDKQAAFLARAFLLDTISTSLKVPCSDLYIAHWPPDARESFEDILYMFENEEKDIMIAEKASGVNLIPQSGENFGQRLINSSKTLFDGGAERVIFVGSDSPLLQALILHAAFELLKKNQAVVGPTFSGRYYLIGSDGHYPALFNGIDWGSQTAYKETVERLDKSGLSWQELEISYDVDSPEELQQLYFDIDNLRLAGENDIAYHTEKCLANLKK